MLVTFLSTLSLRRATNLFASSKLAASYFYPRSPCGERRQAVGRTTTGRPFLSTLSLRRATARPESCPGQRPISIHALLAESDGAHRDPFGLRVHFYPRSPCGERRLHPSKYVIILPISIHALLAESDDTTRDPLRIYNKVFLSTLSLRRATVKCHKKQFLFCS